MGFFGTTLFGLLFISVLIFGYHSVIGIHNFGRDITDFENPFARFLFGLLSICAVIAILYAIGYGVDSILRLIFGT